MELGSEHRSEGAVQTDVGGLAVDVPPGVAQGAAHISQITSGVPQFHHLLVVEAENLLLP